MIVQNINFPKFLGVRCLMMPYIQGDSSSLPDNYESYSDIVDSIFIKQGDIGYLTIDESPTNKGKPHRGTRARTTRALHTEVGLRPGKIYAWGVLCGSSDMVIVDGDVEILLANNIDDSCAVWDAQHKDTSIDGDIGYVSDPYPYEKAIMVKAGEVHKISIFTPHESLPIKENGERQFLRILSSGVHGREPYFTINPKMQ